MEINIVVIPAHNEEKTIGQIVKNAKKYCKVIVVDDFSSDNTGRIARENGARVIRNNQNVGYTASLNLGILKASESADNIIVMDADGQHEPNHIPEMLKPLKDGKADLVIGIRNKKARITEKLFGLFGKLVVGVTDPLCGFRAFKSDVYNNIGFYDNIGSMGAQFAFVAKKKGFRVEEIHIKTNERLDTPRLFGGNSLRSEFMIFKSLMKASLYYLTGIRMVNPKWR